MGAAEKGPVRILCDEIGFPFDRRLEREDVFIAFVRELVREIAHKREMDEHCRKFTGTGPSDASGEVLETAKGMVALDLGLTHEARAKIAASIHDRSHEVNPDAPGHRCDHLVDMLASCASAIRFGLETPCHSRHAAAAAQHIWKHVYGVSRFDSHTTAWEKEWARSKFQAAIISLLPTPSTPTSGAK